MPLSEPFYGHVRAAFYPGELSQEVVDNMNAICNAFDGFTGHDHCTDDLAYALATVRRECGSSMRLNIEEIGRGKGHGYGIATGPYSKVYYGRGPCQITWLANYQRVKVRTGIDCVQFPEKLLDPVSGCVAMFDGMYGGTFTGKGLRTYIVPGKTTSRETFIQCRRIINGLDHALEVASSAEHFQTALQAGYVKPPAPPATRTITVTRTISTRPVRKLPQFQEGSQLHTGLWADLNRLFGKDA